MDSHTVQLLEFQSIMDELCEYCFSQQGREHLRTQEVLPDPDRVGELLAQAVEYRGILESGEDLPDPDFPDLAASLPLLEKVGAVLEGSELSEIGRYILSSLDLKRFILRYALKHAEVESIAKVAGVIPDLKILASEIFKIVDREGELREKQIPELREIRSRLKALRSKAGQSVRAYLNGADYRLYWQNDRAVQREGRTVLPLKVKFKGRIKGIVHEVSSSGATVFIEPMDLVAINNDIVQQENAYRVEVLRLLRSLTARVASHLGELKTAVERVSFLDTLSARAGYAIRHNCYPAVRAADEIRLIAARHPLLGKGAVPIDVELSGGCRMLIVTGPNTGGKTVTLKTVGLLSLMNQFGMEIPAALGSRLAVFDDCFADIGDEQSLEQSLSTFSSHLVTLNRIVRKSSPQSLVLLDELGAGTDPEEGVAIAMALLDYFIGKKSLAIITTHHGILKNYGYTRAGVQNASMEFDTESLVPTFKLLSGIPGESRAIEIAKREGMCDEIIESARSYLSDERSDISKLIEHLSQKERELQATERSHRARESDLKERRREVDLIELRLKQQEVQLRENGIRDLRRFLVESRKELNTLIREIREGQLSKDKTGKTGEFIKRVSQKLEVEEEGLKEARERITGNQEELEVEVGMSVRLKRSGKWGKVIRRGRGKNWIVETESLKIELGTEDFYSVQDSSASADGDQGVEVVAATDMGEKPELQLDLRGLRLEEALVRLERQIDNALIHGLKEFSVIHGKGEGILQRGIRDCLARHDSVADFFFSRPAEGGFGNTIVRLLG